MILKSIVANTPPCFSTLPRPRLQLCGFLATNKFLYDYDIKKARHREVPSPNYLITPLFFPNGQKRFVTASASQCGSRQENQLRSQMNVNLVKIFFDRVRVDLLTTGG